MAQIDPSIVLGVKPVQIEDPINRFARQQELSVNMMKANEMQRGLEDQNALRQLVKEGLDPSTPDFARRAYQVSPELGIKVAKSQADLNKSKFEGVKLEAEAIDSKLKQSRSLLEGISTPEQYMAWHEANHRDPVLGPLLASRGITADQSRARIVDALNRPGGLEKLINESKLGVAKFAEMNTLSAYQQATLNKPIFSAEAGGFVIPPRVGGGGVSAGGAGGGSGAGGGVTPAAGGVIPVEGVKSKSTEAEKQAAYNTKRILTAAKDISKAVENNPSAIAPGFFESIAPGEGAANLARSSDRQLVSSGYADLIDAALYLATGAAYNKEQLEAQKKALLPAFTDTEENRQSKQLKIIELINAAKIRAGKEWTPELNTAVNNLFPSLREAPPINVEGVGTKVNTPGSKAAPAAPAAANTVKLPNGAVKVFPTPEAAAQFRKAAGL